MSDHLADNPEPPESASHTPSLAELKHLRASLTAAEREELLECLLIAASRGGEAVIEVPEQALLCHAAEDLLRAPLDDDF